MERSQVIAELVRIADSLVVDYSYDIYRNMFSMCCDWNSDHEDEEIFMCEDCFNGSECVNGFYIEDDYWIIEA